LYIEVDFGVLCPKEIALMKIEKWIALFGGIWLFVGIGLLVGGLRRLSSLVDCPLGWLGTYLGMSLLIGLFKGQLVFKKSVDLTVTRWARVEGAISWNQVLSWKYGVLMISMMGLSQIARSLPDLVRGCLSVAVGVALIQGAVLYFKKLKGCFNH
jgi:hypothetical protein